MCQYNIKFKLCYLKQSYVLFLWYLSENKSWIFLKIINNMSNLDPNIYPHLKVSVPSFLIKTYEILEVFWV